MHQVKYELKIMGINPLLILSAMVIVFALLAAFGGELLNLSRIGYEVIFPFFAAIAVGEWGKTKSDENYDVIASQGKSLFAWVSARFLAVFALVSLFALSSMVIVHTVRGEMPLWEMFVTYIAPALFLATLAALLNLCFTQEHISILTCGVVWLVTLLTRSLLRFPCVEYVYLFIRYAGDVNNIWLINKAVLILISCALWIITYFICKKRN